MKKFCTPFIVALSMAASVSMSLAAVSSYSANLDGPSEDPPNASTAVGFSIVTIDTTLNTMRVQALFSGLLGPSTVAHIHGPTLVAGAGSAAVMTTTPTFPLFPAGVTSGFYDQTFDMTLASSYRPAFLTANGGSTSAAFASLHSALGSQKAYFNLHSAAFTGGEIRGFYTVIPEPSSAALAGFAVIGLMVRRRR